MVIFDEEPPKKSSEWAIGEDLSKLSIDELEERIGLLTAEIERMEQAITAKRDSIGVADSFFKR